MRNLRGKSNRLAPVAIGVAICVFGPLAIGQDLGTVSLSSTDAAVGSTIDIEVTAKGTSGQSWQCGALVGFGDGTSHYLRLSDRSPSKRLTKTYDKEGNFAVTMEGKGEFKNILNFTTSCSGTTQAAALVIRPENYEEKKAAAEEEARRAFESANQKRDAARAADRKASDEKRRADQAVTNATRDRQIATDAARKAATDRQSAEAKTKSASPPAATSVAPAPTNQPSSPSATPAKQRSASDL